jgi:CDP-diacylglycerol--glycerol-3-phosphate 3-phosphatidyltransferase
MRGHRPSAPTALEWEKSVAHERLLWLWPGILGTLALIGAAATLPAGAELFLVGAGAVLLLVVVVTAVLVRQERHQGRLGVATQLTFFRGLLLAALAGVALQRPQSGWLAWAPGGLYTLAALLDLVDGYVARRRGEQSALGSRLDTALDALGLVLGPAAAVLLGRLPAFYLLVGAAYYLFHINLWLRQRMGRPVFPERVVISRYTRMYAGYQMGLVATTLFPVVGPPGTTVAAALFLVPNLSLFLRDWLLTTGRMQPDDPRHLGLERTLRRTWGPMLLAARVLSAAGIVALALRGQVSYALLLAVPPLLSGLATRLVAFATAVFLTLALARQPSQLLWATYVVTLVSLLGGAGAWALWREDRLLLARAGEDTPPDLSR